MTSKVEFGIWSLSGACLFAPGRGTVIIGCRHYAVSPDTPVFVLHLYDSALLNKAALRVIGYTRDIPNPQGGEILRHEEV
ncbi:hypothetical protein [Morganella morganii]|uniref:hypothetical protein n=1 Tax=Morganella morganii TaxID=582 RepID=UPI00046A99D5|nr:hypothetical protein [Morganella morganii]